MHPVRRRDLDGEDGQGERRSWGNDNRNSGGPRMIVYARRDTNWEDRAELFFPAPANAPPPPLTREFGRWEWSHDWYDDGESVDWAPCYAEWLRLTGVKLRVDRWTKLSIRISVATPKSKAKVTGRATTTEGGEG